MLLNLQAIGPLRTNPFYVVVDHCRYCHAMADRYGMQHICVIPIHHLHAKVSRTQGTPKSLPHPIQ
jgi:hypothetical protein